MYFLSRHARGLNKYRRGVYRGASRSAVGPDRLGTALASANNTWWSRSGGGLFRFAPASLSMIAGPVGYVCSLSCGSGHWHARTATASNNG